MADSSKVESIKDDLNKIIASCHGDPVKSEIAASNFELLISVMQKYERAPRYYNSYLEESDQPIRSSGIAPFQLQAEGHHSLGGSKSPIMSELEKIYGRKLKQVNLQELGSKLSAKTGLKLDRETKRSKVALLAWFQDNWRVLHTKIYELGLTNISFS